MQHQTRGETWLGQRGPEVKPVIMATVVVESLRSGSSARCEVTGLFAHNGQVQREHEFSGTSNYIVHECSVDCGFWQTAGRRVSVSDVSIPSSSELCDGCFQNCSSLCRVIFGHSSSLERIGV